MACTKAQLLVLLSKLEDDILHVCQRETERRQRDLCERILAPLRAVKARIESLAESELEAEIWG